MPVQQFTSRIVWFVPEGHSAKDETRRHETDLARYADTFEGSKVIEKLTDETAPKAKEIPFRLRDVGYTRAISIVGSELTRQLAERQRRLESGEISQVSECVPRRDRTHARATRSVRPVSGLIST